MRRVRTIPAFVLVMLAVAGAAWAGTTAAPSAFKLSVGSTTDIDPIAALNLDDGSYLAVQSRPAGAQRKVAFVTTHTGLPTADETIALRLVGHAGLGEVCDLHFAAFDWRRKRFVDWSFVVLNAGPADQSSAAPRSDGTRFINGQGKLKAKLSCIDERNFTLRADRVTVET